MFLRVLGLSGLAVLSASACFNPKGSELTTEGALTTSTDTSSASSPASASTASSSTESAQTTTTTQLTDTGSLTSGSTAVVCGDGVVDPQQEECDDGNLQPEDWCDPFCRRPSFYVFVSVSKVIGGVSGLVAADNFCQSEATAAGLPGTYRAWLSDSDETPLWRFGKSTSRPYVRTDDQLIAPSWDVLIADGPAVPISVTAEGLAISADGPCVNDVVWTGTSQDGLGVGDGYCMDWSSTEIDVLTAVGSALSLGVPNWTHCGPLTCSAPARFYCFEQALE